MGRGPRKPCVASLVLLVRKCNALAHNIISDGRKRGAFHGDRALHFSVAAASTFWGAARQIWGISGAVTVVGADYYY